MTGCFAFEVTFSVSGSTDISAGRQGESAMAFWAVKKVDIMTLTFFCLVAATSAVFSGCEGADVSEFRRLVRQSNCVSADSIYSDIYSDYEKNEVSARLKYQDKVTRVCGVVSEIKLSLLNEPIVVLKVLGYRGDRQVRIRGIDNASAANLSKGSFAVFECNSINEILHNDGWLTCRIVPVQSVSSEALSDTEVSTPNDGMPNNAMAFAGKYPEFRGQYI